MRRDDVDALLDRKAGIVGEHDKPGEAARARRLATVLALLAGVPAWAGPNGIRIGVLTDMSGTYAALSGQGSVVAAQMAIDDFGGKVLGKPITLVSADH